MHDLIKRLIEATNRFDVDTAVALFAPEAVINDASVGDSFVGTAGVRNYFEQFFVGYNTVSKVLAVQVVSEHRATVRLDFTGDFGHETGVLDITTGPDGRIIDIVADLD